MISTLIQAVYGRLSFNFNCIANQLPHNHVHVSSAITFLLYSSAKCNCSTMSLCEKDPLREFWKDLMLLLISNLKQIIKI